MAASNKNIIITPNTGQTTAQPNIVWTGNAAYAMTTVVADDNSLFWQNATGQLFSISNNLTSGTIFSVNDISGIPFISVNASGNVSLNPLGGANVGIGTASPQFPLHVFGSIVGTTSASFGNIFISNTTAATSTTTGALVVAGGVGIAGNLFTSASAWHGNLSITNSTVSTSTTSGALVVAGGVGIAGNIFVGNSLWAGNASITNTTATTSGSTGALTVAGGVGIAGNLFTSASAWHGNLSITNSTVSTSTTSGALVVAGGVGIAGNLYASSNVVAASFQPTGLSVPPNGMYLPNTNTLSFATNNTQRATIAATGQFLIGTSTAPAGTGVWEVINNATGGGTEWVFNNSGGGNIAGSSGGGLVFSTFTGAIGSESYTRRMIINSTGQVGIGTITPNQNLSVFGGTITANSPGTYALGVWNNGGTATDITLGSDATYGYFQTWNGKIMWLNSQGNSVLMGISGTTVGIGTTNTGGGTLNIQSNYSGAGIDSSAIVIRDTALNGGENRRLVIGPITSTDSMIRMMGNGNLLVVGQSGNELVRFVNTGRVGIGTSYPLGLLDIDNNTATTGYAETAYFRVVNNTTSIYTRMVIGQLATGQMLLETADNNNVKGTTVLQPYGGNVFMVGSGNAGNVVVGAGITGNGRLVVQQVASGATPNTALLLTDGTQTLRFNPNSTSGSYNPIVQSNDTSFIYSAGSSGTGALVIAPWSASTSGIRMDQYGNVSIGFSSVPYATGGRTTLGLNGTNGSLLALAYNGTTQGAFYTDGTQVYMYSINYPASIVTVTAQPIVFQTNNTQRMQINSSGNVGIGTTTISAGNAITVYGGGIFLAGNLQVTNTATTTSGIKFADGTYMTTAAVNGAASTMAVTAITTNATYFPVFVAATSGAQPQYVSASLLNFNPSNGNLTVNGNVIINQATAGTGSLTARYVGIGTTAILKGLNISSGTNSAEIAMFGGSSTTGNAFINVSDSSGNNGGGYNLTIRGLTTNGTAQTNLAGVYFAAAFATSLGALVSNYGSVGITLTGNQINTNSTSAIGYNYGGTAGIAHQFYAGNNSGTLYAVINSSGMQVNGAITIQGSTSYQNLMIFTNPSASNGNKYWRINPSGGLELVNSAYNAVPFTFADGGTLTATGEVIAYYSDRRLKTNVKPIGNAVTKVLSLNGITYNPNDLAESFGYNKNEDIVGLFADEVESVLPQAVKLAPFDNDGKGLSISGNNYKTVQYEKVVPLLVEAIKEQQLVINQLESRIAALENSQ